MRVKSERIEKGIQELSTFGKNKEGGINRVAFSEADLQARGYITELMKRAGLSVEVDEAANIIGRKEGSDSTLAPILFGSHIDSVPNGGAFDGAAGVLCAIECVRIFSENGIITRHPLEVVVFSNEEGGLTGSRGLVGELTQQALELTSQSGRTIREGISFLGGNPDNLDAATRRSGDIRSFVEMHIEQGRILESEGVDIGVVQGIIGIKRWDITVTGVSNHAGTTPMCMRQDALLAAANLIVEINRVVSDIPGNQVGTVGCISARPGAPNVIAGIVDMSLELRDLMEEKISSMFERIQKEAEMVAKRTNTKISLTPVDAFTTPAPADTRVQKIIDESAQSLGLTTTAMTSGAGHDAQSMAKIAPMGMIFIPSVNGISHSPAEYSRLSDIVNGGNVLLHTVLEIDRGALE